MQTHQFKAYFNTKKPGVISAGLSSGRKIALAIGWACHDASPYFPYVMLSFQVNGCSAPSIGSGGKTVSVVSYAACCSLNSF